MAQFLASVFQALLVNRFKLRAFILLRVHAYDERGQPDLEHVDVSRVDVDGVVGFRLVADDADVYVWSGTGSRSSAGESPKWREFRTALSAVTNFPVRDDYW